MATKLTISGGQEPGAAVLLLHGDLDILSVSELNRAVEQAGAAPVVLDLSRVTFVDSTGLHALIELVRTVPGLRVREPSTPVERLVGLTGTARVLGLPDVPRFT